MTEPLKRLAAYSQPNDRGGVEVDVKGMLIDLIAVCKMSGMTLEQFLSGVNFEWGRIEAIADIPEKDKN